MPVMPGGNAVPVSCPSRTPFGPTSQAGGVTVPPLTLTYRLSTSVVIGRDAATVGTDACDA